MKTHYPRFQTVERLLTQNLSQPEIAAFAGTAQIIRGWIRIAHTQSAASALRHIKRLCDCLKTDIPGVIAWHLRIVLAANWTASDEDALAHSDDRHKVMSKEDSPSSIPVTVHDICRAAAIVTLHDMGVVQVVPDESPQLASLLRNHHIKATSDDTWPGPKIPWYPGCSLIIPKEG